jgi:site-specific DNA recombinase
MSLVAATKWLNEQDQTTTRGRPWDRSSVRVMLLNPRNAGLRALNGQVVAKGNWKPIVTEDTWQAMVSKLTDPARKNKREPRKWLGGGLFRCHCGTKVRVNYSHHGTRVYQCMASSHLSRSADKIDAYVGEVMAATLGQPKVLKRLAAAQGTDVRELHAEADALTLRLDQIAVDYADGLLSGRQVQAASARLEGRLQEVQRGLASTSQGSAVAALMSLRDGARLWDEADLLTRRLLIDAVCTVVILPGTRGKTPFDRDTIRIDWH